MPQAHRNEMMSRIGNDGSSSIADERNTRALFHANYQFSRARHFVMFVIADGFFLDAVVIQKFCRAPRVFTGDEVGFPQNSERAHSNVFQVADGSCDKIETSDRIVRRELR